MVGAEGLLKAHAVGTTLQGLTGKLGALTLHPPSPSSLSQKPLPA